MTHSNNFINSIKYSLLNLVFILVPLFFLPVTREYVTTNKFYFLIYIISVLSIAALVNFVITKKATILKTTFSGPLILLVVAIVLSTILISPNKIQALLNPQFGLLGILSMVIMYFFIAHSKIERQKTMIVLLSVSASLVALFSLIVNLHIFSDPSKLPYDIGVLFTRPFNTVGNELELLLFLGFSLLAISILYMQGSTLHGNHEKKNGLSFVYIFPILLIVVALGFEGYFIADSIMKQTPLIVLPPLSISWYAAIEVLKNPITALFGIGTDNFISIFTRVKDISYNSSDFWQLNGFNVSRSTLLQILTEIGLLGFVSMVLLFLQISKSFKHLSMASKLLIGYTSLAIILLPPTFMGFFLFFIALGFITHDLQQTELVEKYEIDLSSKPLIIMAGILAPIAIIAFAMLFVSKTYVSEILYKKSFDAIRQNNLKNLYDSQKQAVDWNPYNESLRISFSQTNLLVANNVAAKKPEEIKDKDRQTITQTIQLSINEAKEAVKLNPQKVSNWQYLASLYRNVMNVAQNADTWSVSSYQQAIALDPQNPALRLELGGIYYVLNNFDDAQRLFEQTVALKRDWPNAHYNLAWTLYQKQDYKNAVTEMQNVITLLDQQKSTGADYKKAKADLAEFMKKLPEDQANSAAQQQESAAAKNNLGLPTPPVATLEPKVKLPPTSPAPHAPVTTPSR
jgi:Flp pilus assembly protein TadD